MLRPVVRTCLRPWAATALASPATAPTPAPTSAQCIAHRRLLSTSLLRPKSMLLCSPPSLHHHAGRHSPALASLPSARRHFAAATSTNAPPLSWDEFLRLRRQRRLAGLIASFPTAILGLCGGGLYFATQELDPTQTILGIDPYIMSVVFTAGCGLFGWLMGPTVGRGVWHLVHRKQAQLVTEREAQFFKHIQRNRADPSFQSYSNPVPDYYGEKIGSLKDYKRWLKDQRAYKLKARKFL